MPHRSTFFFALFFCNLLYAAHPLNRSGFAGCLIKEDATRDLRTIKNLYRFSELDGLILYLSAYPSKRLPAAAGIPQDRARHAWSVRWERGESQLAQSLIEVAEKQTALFPDEAFHLALTQCRRNDAFCASLLLHNVLRTLGRWQEGFYQEPFFGRVYNLNPAWFRDYFYFYKNESATLQRALIPLRPQNRGDRWGEWYHFFGILSYAIHALSLEGTTLSASFAVKMGEILNPLLAGGPEEKEKAALDHDAVQIAWLYLRGKKSDAHQDCRSLAAYVSKN